jgi:hypothetical protein
VDFLAGEEGQTPRVERAVGIGDEGGEGQGGERAAGEPGGYRAGERGGSVGRGGGEPAGGAGAGKARNPGGDGGLDADDRQEVGRRLEMEAGADEDGGETVERLIAEADAVADRGRRQRRGFGEAGQVEGEALGDEFEGTGGRTGGVAGDDRHGCAGFGDGGHDGGGGRACLRREQERQPGFGCAGKIGSSYRQQSWSVVPAPLS